LNELVDEDEAGRFPATVGYIRHYQPQTATTRQFLRLFAGCSDIVPKAVREAIGELYFHEFGTDLEPQHVMRYRSAARRLDELRLGRSDLAW
jgi:hypothetical protein